MAVWSDRSVHVERGVQLAWGASRSTTSRGAVWGAPIKFIPSPGGAAEHLWKFYRS